MSSSEQYRAECEARYWLNKGYLTPSKIDELRDFIAKKRGLKAANYLIENMRLVWKKEKTK